ncbi:MAG: endonuclease/exonuclease/phosphatase family protein [Clostridia bacterium]|nr:endonuclease/exonuclease/phosphatase family protein [Clostridia bacterium]
MMYKIMSNNIWRCDENNAAWAAAGADCSAEARVPGLFKVYTEKEPDILGLQECSPHMADLLMRRFSENKLPYALIWGKDTPVIYRTDKFELVDSEFLIYPEAVPDYAGSFNNFWTKSYCIAVLRAKADGGLLIFASTHLWWKSSDPENKNYQPYSDEARAHQLNMLMDRIDVLQAKYDCPAVIVGDFNAVYASQAVQAALQRGYHHAHDLATEYRDETYGMHYCYPDRYDTTPYAGGFTKSIDHILLRGAKEGCVARFERYAPEYYMPVSDHFPVWIDMEL